MKPAYARILSRTENISDSVKIITLHTLKAKTVHRKLVAFSGDNNVFHEKELVILITVYLYFGELDMHPPTEYSLSGIQRSKACSTFHNSRYGKLRLREETFK